jgi:hypothetical protein
MNNEQPSHKGLSTSEAFLFGLAISWFVITIFLVIIGGITISEENVSLLKLFEALEIIRRFIMAMLAGGCIGHFFAKYLLS